VVDLTRPFSEVYAFWLETVKRREILDDAKYDHVLAAVQSSQHRECAKYRARGYEADRDLGTGVWELVVRANAFHKKQPSGRHITLQHNVSAAPASLVLGAEAALTDAAPAAASSQTSAAAAADDLLPHSFAQGRVFPGRALAVNRKVVRASQLIGILQRFHDAGHPGIDSSYQQLSLHYHGIPRDLVIGWVSRCGVCKQRQRTPKPPPKVLTAIPTEGWLMHVEADCLSFLDKRRPVSRLRVILHFRCIASKWSELVLLPNKEEATMRLAFWRIFARVGVPRVLHTDNGSEFKNPSVQGLLRECECLWVHGEFYKPSTQGVVERGNKVLRPLLDLSNQLSRFAQWEFEDILAQTQYYMNSLHSRTTKQSAYMYVFGSVPRPLFADAEETKQYQQMLDQSEADKQPQISSDCDNVMMELDIPAEASSSNDDAEERKGGTPPAAAAAAANAEWHADRRQAGNMNHSIYQAQWLARANHDVTDAVFAAGQLAYMTVASKRKHKALAKQLDKQKVLVLQALPYSKYAVLSAYGMLKDPVHANELALVEPNCSWPAPLAEVAQDRAHAGGQLAAQHLRHFKDKKSRKLLTVDTLIMRILEIETVPISAAVEMLQPQPGDTEIRPVVKIKLAKKRKDY